MAKASGKVAEGKITAWLKEVTAINLLWWGHRIPDAGVCMGRLPKQPADYFLMHDGVSMLAEVKECKRETSVPASRFTQAPKMRRFAMAKGKAGFFLYFRYAEEPYWNYVPVDDVIGMDKSLKMTGQYKKFFSIEDCMDYISKNILVRG